LYSVRITTAGVAQTVLSMRPITGQMYHSDGIVEL